MSANANADTLVETLSAFVAETCADRDESHGHPHMKAVYEDSIRLFEELFDPSRPNYDELRMLVTICSWLHDVADHKYDPHGALKEKVCAFLAEDLNLDQPTVGLICSIIDYVSFSKENKALLAGTPIDFGEIFGKYAIIRHIVSDADKNQAMGEIGVVRCAQYTMEKNPDCDVASLKNDIIVHFDEKLGRLYTDFIRTSAGKALTEPSHERMVEIIGDLDAFLLAHPEIIGS
jgi:hypothetical protein